MKVFRPILTKVVLLWLFSLLIISASFAMGAEISVYVNGKQILFPDQLPFIDANGRTLVPLRFISEELGAEVKWIPDERKVVINKGDSIILTINSSEVLVNGVLKKMDTVPVLVNSRTMVPLRFVSEILGCKVSWISDQRRVDISVAERKDESEDRLDENDEQEQAFLPEKSELVDEANISVNNGEVTLEIKFKKDISKEEIENIADKTSFPEVLWYWAVYAEVNGGEYTINYPDAEISFDKKDLELKVTNIKLPPPTSEKQVVVYEVHFSGRPGYTLMAQFPAVTIEPDPDREPIYIKEATVTKGDNPGSVHIVMRFNEHPGHYLTGSSVKIIKEVNGVKDDKFDHTEYWSLWEEDDLTLVIKNVKLPEPKEIPQEIVFTIFFKDQPPVKTKPYVVPAKL